MRKIIETLKLALFLILLFVVGTTIFLYAMNSAVLMLFIIFGIPFLIVCYCIVGEFITDEETYRSTTRSERPDSSVKPPLIKD